MRNTQYIAAGLADADMVWLLSAGKLRKLKPGETLVEAGRPVAELYFVLDGVVAVIRPDGAVVARLCESDMIGEMSFIEQRAPSVTVRAEGRAEILCIARDTILQRFEQEPAFAARFYRAIGRFLSARLRETTAAAFRGEIAPPEPAAQSEDRFRGLLKRLGVA